MATKKTAEAAAPTVEVLDPETAPLPALLADSVPTVPPGTALEVVIEQHAALMIVDNDMFDALVTEIRQEITAFVPNLTTDKGRKEVAALAAKVARTKTAIDRARKALTERMRITTKRVNDVWSDREERLNALRDEARKPLDDWEAAEKKRTEMVSEGLTALRTAGIVREGETSASVQTRLNVIMAHTLEPSIYGEDYEHAVELKASVVDSLTSAIARLKVAEEDRRQAEIDRAELAELRAQKAAREQADAEARDKAEQEQAEREREERAAAEAEQRRKEAEERAERERAEAVERGKREEREKIEREQREKADREAKERADAERLANNKKHRAAVIKAAAEALVRENNLLAGTALAIVESILAGKITNVHIQF